MANINKKYSKNAKLFSALKNIFFILLALALVIIFWSWIKRVASSLAIIVPYIKYVIYLFIIVCVINTLSALNKRRKFIKKFKKYCSENKVRHSEIKKPYVSVFWRTKGESFVLRMEGKEYSCKLISFSNKLLPVIFNDNGTYHRISAKKLKKGLTPTFQRKYTFDYDSSLQQILILTSIPYVVLANNKNTSRPVDAGVVCGKFTIFNPSGFFGALSRSCLDMKKYQDE